MCPEEPYRTRYVSRSLLKPVVSSFIAAIVCLETCLLLWALCEAAANTNGVRKRGGERVCLGYLKLLYG